LRQRLSYRFVGVLAFIQEAIDFAASGDTIEIKPGKYIERPRVNKELTLSGITNDPSDVIIVEAGNRYDPVLGKFGAMTFYASADVQLYNLTIRNRFDESSFVGKAHSHAARFDKRVYASNIVIDGGSDSLNITGEGFFHRVTIRGTNDFVYGKGNATFVDSDFVSEGSGSVFAQGSQGVGTAFNVYQSRFHFRAAGNQWLARPWQSHSTVRIIDSLLTGELRSERYREHKGYSSTSHFFECGNRGRATDSSQAVNWSFYCNGQ